MPPDLLSTGFTRSDLLAQRQGYGQNATGGLLGPEVVVTTLADDPSAALNTTGNMSLRGALALAGPKWITFARGMTAPARSTWPAPYNNAPLSAWSPNLIWIESGRQMSVPPDTTIDGRGASIYGVCGRGFQATGSNVIVYNMIVDFSQWWAAELSQGTAGLYNIWDADMAYSKGPQAIQRAGQCYDTTTVDNTKLPGNWKGTWVSGHAYQAGDIPFDSALKNPPDGVAYNGIGYKCILATSGTTPPPSDPTHWQPAIGGSVNGQIYLGIKEQVVSGSDVGYQDFFFAHNTFIGPAVGDGNPARNQTTLWDFNDGGYSVCYMSHHVTYAWNHFQDCNKSIIIGCGSTDQTDSITVHNNRFQRGIQRQPLARDSHVHIFANWYDQPGLPDGSGQVIACDNNVEVLYEGNLAESQNAQNNAFAYKRGGTNTHIVGFSHGNVALGQMRLAADVGTLSFSPSYAYALPDLTTSAAQQAFRDSMTANAGALLGAGGGGGGGSSGWRGRKYGAGGGGRGNACAIDPVSGTWFVTGDLWGPHTSGDQGDSWQPCLDGLSGIGQVYGRAVAASKKNPGVGYWGLGTLTGGGGGFGITQPGSQQITRITTGAQFGTSQVGSPAGITPRAVGQLIVVDYDPATGIEYIYAAASAGVMRSTTGGQSWTTIASVAQADKAWKAITLAPDGSLYALTYGTRTSNTGASGQTLYHITSPRGAATNTTIALPGSGPVNDLRTIGGAVWALTTSGLYKLVSGAWQVSLGNGQLDVNLSSLDGVGQTMYVTNADAPTTVAGHCVAKTTDGGQTWRWVTPASAVQQNMKGTSIPWWLAGHGLPESYATEQISVDPSNANRVLLAGFRGAFCSVDGGATWWPAMNQLCGTVVQHIGVGSGGNVWNDDLDWGGFQSGDYDRTGTRNASPPAMGVQGLSKTVGSNTYSVDKSVVPMRVLVNGVDQADAFTKGALFNPYDLQVSPDQKAIYIAQYGGGVTVMDAPGSVVVQPPVAGQVSISDTTPTAAEVITALAVDLTWGGTKPLTYAYQWQVAASSAGPWANATGAGAATASYTVAAGDVGKVLRCQVTGQNTAGSAAAFSAVTSAVAAAATVPANTAPPSISDSTPQVGETLIGSSGAWSGTPGPSFSGAWQVAATTAGPWSAGAGTVSQTTFPGDTYVPAAGDAGQVLRFTVTATNSAGSASANANPTGSIGGAVGTAPTIVTAPTITNAGSPPHVGDSLIGTQGVWNGSPTSYAYQWQVSFDGGQTWQAATGTGGATLTYTIAGADADGILRLRVTATNAGGSTNAASLPTQQVITAPTSTLLAADSITVHVQGGGVNVLSSQDTITVHVTPTVTGGGGGQGGGGPGTFGGDGTGQAYDYSIGTRIPAWLRLDGTEIANPARTLDYLRFGAAGPGVANVGPSPCAALYRIDGQPQVYVAPNEDPAPWYDPLRPESGQFFGVIVNGFALNSITKRSPVDVAGRYGGSVVGPRQSIGRRIDVQASIVASSCSGAEFGMEWLSGVLGESGCATCGASTLEFRQTCPPDDSTDDELGLWHAYRCALVSGPDVAAQDPLCNITDVTWSWASASPYLYKPPQLCVAPTILDSTDYGSACLPFDTWLCGQVTGGVHCCTVDPPFAGTWAPIITVNSQLGVGEILVQTFATCPPDVLVDQPVSQMAIAELSGTLVIDCAQHLITYISPDGTIVRDGTDHILIPPGQALDWMEVDACDLAKCLCVSTAHPCSGGENATVQVEIQYRRR